MNVNRCGRTLLLSPPTDGAVALFLPWTQHEALETFINSRVEAESYLLGGLILGPKGFLAEPDTRVGVVRF